MNKAIRFSMTETERVLVAETERVKLLPLDEDALLALETRVRRARNKYVKLYRRQASARVGDVGGRGFAGPKGQRDRDKAEVFELALARVSRQVAAVAKRASDELRAERLNAARRNKQEPSEQSPIDQPGAATGRLVPHTKSIGGVKKDASTRSMGARRQAKRDSR